VWWNDFTGFPISPENNTFKSISLDLDGPFDFHINWIYGNGIPDSLQRWNSNH
jgi:hypothetical protein